MNTDNVFGIWYNNKYIKTRVMSAISSSLSDIISWYYLATNLNFKGWKRVSNPHNSNNNSTNDANCDNNFTHRATMHVGTLIAYVKMDKNQIQKKLILWQQYLMLLIQVIYVNPMIHHLIVD